MYKPTGTALGVTSVPWPNSSCPSGEARVCTGNSETGTCWPGLRLPEPVFGGRTGLASVSVLFRLLPFFPGPPVAHPGAEQDGQGTPSLIYK